MASKPMSDERLVQIKNEFLSHGDCNCWECQMTCECLAEIDRLKAEIDKANGANLRLVILLEQARKHNKDISQKLRRLVKINERIVTKKGDADDKRTDE